jgi:acetylornithine deacetylase/succinyl-diaminopimelate desuccinylase-like protein
MSREQAIASIDAYFERGEFLAVLGRMVGYKTESQSDKRGEELQAYLDKELVPQFEALGFTAKIVPSPSGRGPNLLATYHESDDRPTVLMYGHGDVVPGMEGEWRDGLDPWRCTTVGDRVYGRGTADNKGQHAINIAALRAVHEVRGGRLGFNVKFIVEMGEEIGSPDLPKICESLRDELKADVFIASDGCRRSGRPSSLVAAVVAGSISISSCVTARIIPAIGADCSPIPRRSSHRRLRRWSIATAASCSMH